MRKSEGLAVLLGTVCLLSIGGCAASQEIDLGIYVTDYLDEQVVQIKPLGGEVTDTARLFASPGEFEPASFTVRPTERVEQMMMHATALAGPAGTIPGASIRLDSVEQFHGGDRNILMPLGRPWDMPAYQRELFWATVRVPDDAKPGTYRGAVNITSHGEKVGQVNLELEVLPVALPEPPYALGYNYSSPKNPDALAAHLQDMRDHGMTTVGPLYNFHLPIHDEDTVELGEFIEAYAAAGFRQPLYFASPMSLTVGELTGYGPVDSRRFQRKYISTMRKLHAEGQQHDVPVIFSIGDEFTNKGMLGVEYGEQLARLTYEELPEIVSTSDMNGYEEVVRMAPYLDVATFNNGWDGADRHNKGKRLVNREFILGLQETGAIPWFVNTGSGRFPFGLFFWKMAKYGVKGKVEWYYSLGNNERGSVVRTEGTQVWPTVVYERSREGIDDLRYLCALEQAVAEAKKAGQKQPEVAAAERLLKEIADSIIDNWTAYTSGGEEFSADGFDTVPDEQVTSLGSFNAVRRAVANAIVSLRGGG
jgi:hypothetical protein